MADTLTHKDYDRGHKPTWCIGCGDYGVLRVVQEAFADLKIPNHNLAVISGIGCSGRISGYINGYTYHSAHGRSLPVAQGVKYANPNLTVLAMGGDGDGFAIGLSHSLHAARRNTDITYITMTNNVYGLTKGQTSPASPKGFVTGFSPYGSKEENLIPTLMMLSAGAGFIAQGFTAKPKELRELIIQGIRHEGFSYINIYSPCVTFNKIHTYKWFEENLVESDHDFNDIEKAFSTIIRTKGLATGLLYQRPS